MRFPKLAIFVADTSTVPTVADFVTIEFWNLACETPFDGGVKNFTELFIWSQSAFWQKVGESLHFSFVVEPAG